MSRIFIASRGNPEHLAQLFRAEFPDFAVTTTQPDPAGPPVPYVVAGRPEKGVITAVPGVELVLSLNAGIEHLLEDGMVPAGVPIVRMVDDGLSQGMTEWVIAQALAWHRNLFHYAEVQKTAQWQPRAEKLARERKVCVLGAGALGAPVAALFARIGFETRVWSRSGQPVPGATSFAGPDRLIAAVSGADILVNLLPLTPETRDIVDAPLLAAMAKGGFFINGARGAHVVDAALIEALDAGQLEGAALDLFRVEPLPAQDPLWHHPKIRISPHVAAPTHAAIAVKEMAGNLRRFMRGETLQHAVNRQLGY